MSGFRLQRLDHVSLNVSDRPRSTAWYRDVLGIEPRNESAQDDSPVFMGSCLALFQAEAETADRNYESVGLRHVAFLVGRIDLERARAHLGECGVEFRLEDHGGAQSVYFPDPGRQRDRADELPAVSATRRCCSRP